MTEKEAQNILLEYKQSPGKNFTLLAGDASSRQYYRYADLPRQQSVILTLYPGENTKSSLERYLYWQKKYHDAKLLVPKVIAVDQDSQVVLQEDVGNLVFQSELGNASIEDERNLLHAAISLLPKIRHLQTTDFFTSMPSFNLEKLQFEINHTLKYFIGNYLERKEEIESLQKLWVPLLQRLERLPMHICHRDYHSRNLMCRENKLYIIDFQDSMLGPIQYDLCSLLDDCYIKHRPVNYQSLMREFFEIAVSEKHHSNSYEEFFINYHLVKLQRQFKAIGSFCYVWSDKKNVRYLKYISYVMESLKSSFEILNLPELNSLKEKVFALYYEN